MAMKDYDIIVVGAGTAGMMCAIFAAKRGLRTMVLEKADHIGGAMHWSGGHMSAGGTKLQKRLGIEDSPEKHYEDIMRINGGSGDLALIRKAVDLAPQLIDWLDDNGFEFDPIAPRIVYGHVPYETPRTHYGVESAKTTLKTMMPHWEKGVAAGLITVALEHEVQRVSKIGDRYSKVHCTTQDGEKVYEGHHILLTTGGYGSNPEFFNDQHPGIPLVSAAYPTATGDGHLMIMKEHGSMRFSEHHLSSMGGIENPNGSGRCDFFEGWASVLTSVYRQPRDIYVDQQGDRFITEDEINPDTRERVMLANDIWHFWIIFDEAALLERDDQGNENPIIINWNTEKIKLEAERERFLYRADTIKELSAKINIPPNNLIKTVNNFNAMVDNDHDPDFGREYLKNKISEAPFYALKVHASVLVTFGGVNVNANLQVLNKEGDVLEGLYAAGELIGLGATSGSAFCSGMSITPALSFGRWLGDTLKRSNAS